MGAALRAGDRVDLVDDHVIHVPQRLADSAGEHQVERFGRGDQDVRGASRDLASLLRGRVAGPGRDRDVRRRGPQSLRREPDAGQRRPQVPLDVVGQGLQRRDVQDPDVAGIIPARRGTRVGRKAVQAPQEGRQRLAAPRRGVDERVTSGRDRRPTERLGVRRGFEARLEPARGPPARTVRADREAVVPRRAPRSRPWDTEYMASGAVDRMFCLSDSPAPGRMARPRGRPSEP